MSVTTSERWLDLANEIAKEHSGCLKVQVGSVIVQGDTLLSAGANRVDCDECGSTGCLRIAKYGDNHKTHRNPEDCRAIHSEIDAIATAAFEGRYDLDGATMYITRYPCEACARAIVRAGIKNVVYGREQRISEYTHMLFLRNQVTVIHLAYWKETDVWK
jgi:dCMP deaminase